MNIYDHLAEYEDQELRFYIITRIKIKQAMDFYTAMGRFPTDKEIEVINYFGVDTTVRTIQLGKPIVITDTMYQDLENLNSAKLKFELACRDAFKTWKNTGKKIISFFRKSSLILLSSLLLSGCLESEIEPTIQPYVNSFFEEATKRGIRIHQTNIHVKFKKLNGPQGRAVLLTNTIYIDPSHIGWRENPEALIFHELGHLILGRDHLNTRINGFCRSIMSTLDDPIYNSENLNDRREYYINELFNPNTPIPNFML